MSRYYADTEGCGGNLRVVLIADVRQSSHTKLVHTQHAHNVRPLSVAEVLPPRLRSGSLPGDDNIYTSCPSPRKAYTPRMLRAHGRSVYTQQDCTPSYQPGRYGLGIKPDVATAINHSSHSYILARSLVEPERYGAFSGGTNLPTIAAGRDRSGTARNLGSDLLHAQSWTPSVPSARAGVGTAQAFPKEPQAVPSAALSGHHLSSTAEPDTLLTSDMLQGGPLGSASAFMNQDTSSWQPGAASTGPAGLQEQPASALTSTLVSRMEALRAQLLKVSSTLSGVQERAAYLSSSMGHKSHSLLHTGGGSRSQVGASIPAASTPAATAQHQHTYPTYQQHHPGSYGSMGGGSPLTVPYGSSSAGGASNSSGGGASNSTGPGARVFMVSVSRAAEPQVPYTSSPSPATPPSSSSPPPPQPLFQPPVTVHGLQATQPPSHLSVTLTPRGANTVSAAVAAAASPASSSASASGPVPAGSPVSGAWQSSPCGGYAAQPYVPSPMYSPVQRPEAELSPSSSLVAAAAAAAAAAAVASPPGGIAGGMGTATESAGSHHHQQRHPFELNSPAARTQHVSLQQQQPQQLSTTEGDVLGASSSSHCQQGSSPDGTVGRPAAPDSSPDLAPASVTSAAASLASFAPPAPSMSPSAGIAPAESVLAAAVSAGVPATTLASAFTRQLDSPLLKELHQQYQQQQQQEQQRQLADQASSPGNFASTPVPGASASASVDGQMSSRFTWGGVSAASSLDAERVHPWNGGNTLLTAMYTPPSTSVSYLRTPGTVDSISGGAAAADATGRSLDMTLSVASSLDAARVYPYPWGVGAASGAAAAGDGAVRSLELSCQGSLELMSAAAPSPPARASAVGTDAEALVNNVGGGVGGRGGLTGGSRLLQSPTVVVVREEEEEEADGAGGPADKAPVVQADGEDGYCAGGNRTNESTLPSQVLSPPPPQQQRDSAVLTANVAAAAAGAPSSPHADLDGAGGSGSASTSPTPRADLSFAFQDASFCIQGEAGEDDGEDGAVPAAVQEEKGGADGGDDGGAGYGTGGRVRVRNDDWPVRKLVLTDEAVDGSVAATVGSCSSAGGGAAALAGAGGRLPCDEDEFVLTPSAVQWRSHQHRYGNAGGVQYSGDVSDVDSEHGTGGGSVRSKESGSGQPWRRDGGVYGTERRRRDSGGGGIGGNGLYDGYSTEEGEEGCTLRESIGESASTAPVQSQEAPRQQQDSHRRSSGVGPDAVAEDTFTFPSAEVTDRAAAAAAAAAAALRGVVAVQRSSSSGGGAAGVPIALPGWASGGSNSARSSNSGYGLGSPGVSGSFEPGFLGSVAGGSGSGDSAGSQHHLNRLARPSRIVVPSSPRSSLGGWSQPSPVPSPYTYGVVGVRTPSSSGAPNFSLRQHLDMTVSSCLFGDSSDEDEDVEAGEEVEGRRLWTEDEELVEVATAAVESRPGEGLEEAEEEEEVGAGVLVEAGEMVKENVEGLLWLAGVEGEQELGSQ